MASKGPVGYRVGDLCIDIGRGVVRRGDDVVALPRLSFDMLVALVEAAPNLVSLDELMRRIWPGLVVNPETVSQRVKLLRRALGDDPHQPRYIAGVRGRGYRLLAPVEASTDVPATGDRVGERPRPTGHLWPRRQGALLAVASLLALVAAALNVGLRSDRAAGDRASPGASPAVPRPVVAVLPFTALGPTAHDQSIASGLQRDVVSELSRHRSLDVIAATSVEPFRGTTSSVSDVGQTLGATHVLFGSVERSGDRMRIRTRLVAAETSEQVWAETFERELAITKLAAVRSEIAGAVADSLRTSAGGAERQRGSTASTSSIDAWAMESSARVLLERRDAASIIEAERLFRQAIALDPNFARAWSGLADAIWLKADYAGLPWLPAVTEAERLANHALRLDPQLVEALATRAKIAETRLDFATAEALYQRVFELNPNYARAYAWYAQILFQGGRDLEARAATRRAVDLDPMSASLRVNMGLSVARRDDLADALAWMEKAREIAPDSPVWARGKASVFAFAGRYDEALYWSLESLTLDPGSARALIDAARWHLELDDLDQAANWSGRTSDDDGQIPGSFSRASLLHLYSGETAQAVDFARRALALDPRDVEALLVIHADALRRDDPAAVVASVRTNLPEFAGPQLPGIRRSSLAPATDLALALRLTGDARGSKALLDAASAFLGVARRNESPDLFIDEVRIAAIRGDREAALRALGSLVRDGWRGPTWRFHRDHDPALDGLRADPRFRAAFATVEQDIRWQRSRAARRVVKTT